MDNEEMQRQQDFKHTKIIQVPVLEPPCSCQLGNPALRSHRKSKGHPSSRVVNHATGLTAARNLHKEGLKVLLLEARGRVGGRTLSIQHKDHGTVDLGGAYVGPTQYKVLRLIKEFNLKTYKVDESDESVMNFRHSWKKYKGNNVPISNPFTILDLNHLIRTLEDMSKAVPPATPWTAKKAKQWDSISVQEFLLKTCWTRTAQSFGELFIRSVFCVETWEISLLFALWEIRQAGGIDMLTSITNGAQEMKVVGGTQQLSQLIAKELGQKVKLDSPVVSVEQSQSNSVYTVRDMHGNTFKGRYVICAVPPPLMLRIHFDPPLPDLKRQLFQRMPMGSIIKSVMYYKTAFWRKKGLNGIAASDHGPVAYCVDDTKPDGSHPAIMGFILADQARELTQLSVSDRKKALCEHYTKAFGDADFLTPIGYEEKNWMGEEYSGGCYTSVMAPGTLTGCGSALRLSFENISFCGTEIAMRWRGYMEGAISSGERVGLEVLHKMGKKRIDINELDEHEYPEKDYGARGVERYLPSISRLMKICIGLSLYTLFVWTRPYFFGWRGYFTWKFINYWD
ncbi:hypothetical protein FSP39_011668 [Pinctada imbricata]|uniref:monoamine oxidase n=1 Tax=Pinctada imbricata TaxID=66713 RepID=A0AA88XW38_PINIB|nr:hypothetical protein FSP39_011668 [Pinctada imbricata]